MNKYVLIGIPSSGKSTIGRRSAEILQVPFYNTDKLAYERLTPEERGRIFLHSGMARFINEQYALMAELAELDGPGIIEVWPESVMNAPGIEAIKKIGTIIYIKREMEAALAEELKKENRLILHGINTDMKIDMRAEAVKMYAKDLYWYEAVADMTLDNCGSEDEGVEKLVAMIREHQKSENDKP